MNSAPGNNNDKLDRLLDESLNNLPEYQAPESLLPNVLARIAEHEASAQLPWLARLRWPVAAISACAAILATFYSQVLFQALLGVFNIGQFSGEIETLNKGILIFDTLESTFAKVFSLIPASALYAAAALAFLFTAFSCAGFGTVLVRLTRARHSLVTPKSFQS